MGETKETLLLHACCAPCLVHPFRLLSGRFDITVFFYNPNIQPESEYQRRLEEITRLAERWAFPLQPGPYDYEAWLERIRGHEQDPEGGPRCGRCFRLRLEKTAAMARILGFSHFGTTLTVSPHKKADTINQIGSEVGKAVGVAFLEADFKKQDGFRIACRLSQEEGLYRQDYCGCLFSRRMRDNRRMR